MAIIIESHQNKIFKRIKGFAQKKNRDREGVFVAEGVRFVSEIPPEWEVELFLVAKAFEKENDIHNYETRAETYLLTDELFALLSDTENPQGVLAVCKKQKEAQEVIWKKDAPFFLLAEELNDPGNLGTVIRTADACGADGIFLSKGSVDVYNPKVLRATMGSVFHVPIFQNADLEEVALKLNENDISLYAAHLKGDCYPYHLPLEKGCAFLIGNEARGLSDEAAAFCDRWVKIPMPGKAESLNASIAAGVLMYEVVRQRLKEPLGVNK
ncbi:MAG: RNA methyltransferase [Clostridia bacterium]|nr:RNA methyltransferase [Anaerotignum sp.]NCC15375.1 RNA methyltransferase [Clostridia bacterium]